MTDTQADTKRKLLDLDEETEQRILKALDNFQGLGTTMESALGALIIGQYFGWRVLKLLHNPATYRRYEKALGIEFKALCPEITEAGKKKSIGYAITEKLGSFWAVITGKRKVADKGMIKSPEEVERRVAEVDKEVG
jgi:hypothetical protein